MIVMKFSGFDVLVWDDDDPVQKLVLKDPKTVDLARQIAERFREEVNTLRLLRGEHG
jgi:hypothetical protein